MPESLWVQRHPFFVIFFLRQIAVSLQNKKSHRD